MLKISAAVMSHANSVDVKLQAAHRLVQKSQKYWAFILRCSLQSCHSVRRSEAEIASEVGWPRWWVRTTINSKCCMIKTMSKGTNKTQAEVILWATCQSRHSISMDRRARGTWHLSKKKKITKWGNCNKRMTTSFFFFFTFWEVT